MADFSISSEELRQAAEQLRRATALTEPGSAETAAGLAALGSDEAHAALSATSRQQAARARKLTERLTSLSDVLVDSAGNVQNQDEQLADGLGG